MAKVYHINGDSVSPCKAVKGQCPYQSDDKETHFSDPAVAMKVLEERLSEEYNKGLTSMTTFKPKTQGVNKTAPVGKEYSNINEVKKGPQTPEEYLEAIHKAEDDAAAAAEAQAALKKEIREYDSKHGAAEGRAYYYDYSKQNENGDYKVSGVNPKGQTYFKQRPEDKERLEAASKKWSDKLKGIKDAQTAMEEAGHGDKIPDDGNVLRVANQAQKWLLENELKGQISDGHWENTARNPWKDWTSAKVVVDPKNVGRNFDTTKDNYQLNSKELLEVVGDRMIADVKKETGKDYDAKQMNEDLKDLRKIFKTRRPRLDSKAHSE